MQCEKKFFLTGVAPIAFNAVWITVAILNKSNAWGITLSIAIVGGFLGQWLMTAPRAFSCIKSILHWRRILRVRLFSKEFQLVLKPLLLSIIGIGAVQINSALDGVFARFASLEGPAYLWYAIRLEQLPVALFGIALSSALLPSLSRSVKSEEPEQFHSLVSFAIRRSFSLMMPCTIGIFVWGAAAVNLIYGRGDFTDLATTNTIICLWAYAIGLVPTVLVLVLAPALYARKNYRTPTVISVLSVALNIGLNAVMVFWLQWGAFSIAIATSICAFLNCWLLLASLSKKIGPILQKDLLQSFAKTTICGITAGFLTVFISGFLGGNPTLDILYGHVGIIFSHHFFDQLMQFGIPFALFGVFTLALARLMNAQDILELIKMTRKASHSEIKE